MLKLLFPGSTGPQVQLLQLALRRAGEDPGASDGVFGRKTSEALRRFQRSQGLAADGIAGRATHAALLPWYTGSVLHILARGDSFYRLARRYGSSVAAIEAANPGLDPLRLPVGTAVTVPLGFPVVPTDIDWCSELVRLCCEGILLRYPAVAGAEIGRSVMDRPLWSLRLGRGSYRVLWNAAHHANEWITVPLLLAAAERLAKADAFDEDFSGRSARALLDGASLTVVPGVNPDGMDLVTGDLTGGTFFENAKAIAAAYPAIPFPGGWKANILGTDPNLQYPAGWEKAREIKFAQGYVSPAPRDYVGPGPLSAPESRAMAELTERLAPDVTLSYHTQGRVIYWNYLDFDPPGAAALAAAFSALSGYAAETTPYASGFAGYKDWFIRSYDRPGFTVEAGLGDNPLPLSRFDRIRAENDPLLARSLFP